MEKCPTRDGKDILAIQMSIINGINDRDEIGSATLPWDLEMVINTEDV